MLWQFRCKQGGTLFYYIWGGVHPPAAHIVVRCPVCGSKKIEATGRSWPDFDEYDDTKLVAAKAGAA